MGVIRRGLLAGLAAMGVVALVTAVWPHVAGWVFGVLLGTLSVVCAIPVVAATCWVRGELARRRDLRAIPVLDAAASYAPSALTLRELRESA